MSFAILKGSLKDKKYEIYKENNLGLRSIDTISKLNSHIYTVYRFNHNKKVLYDFIYFEIVSGWDGIVLGLMCDSTIDHNLSVGLPIWAQPLVNLAEETIIEWSPNNPIHQKRIIPEKLYKLIFLNED